MDIVYPLGTESKEANMEIRYSLRSIQKNIVGAGNVFVVGTLPKFLKDVIHIPMDDVPGPSNKELSIMKKIYTACKDKRLSNKFLMMNDDHFFNRPYHIEKIPNWKWKHLDVGTREGYRLSVGNTVDVLGGGMQDNYDVHTPIIYDKKKFIKTMDEFDWSVFRGYVIKSLYANYNKLKGEELPDLKINRNLSKNHIYTLIDRPVFSVGEWGLNIFMKQILEELYPQKSRWEI
jgi:hypothetical protein